MGAVVAASLLAGACGGVGPDAADAGPVVLTLWTHDGTDAETQALDTLVEEWNTTSTTSTVEVVDVPEGDYGHVVQTAIIAGTLPDLVEVDGPLVASYVYQDALAPLDGLVDDEAVAGLLPSLRAQGTVDDSLYAVGMFESGLGIWASRSRLEEAGVRVPTGRADAWDADETTAALRALATGDDDGLVLDVKRAYGVGEWLTYGFAPLLWSAGADLVDRETGTAHDVLDSPVAVAAMRTLGDWSDFVDPDPADTAFVDGDVALSWVGHWEYGRYRQALGDDLVLLPLPDLGRGSHSSHGSWAWGVSSASPHQQEAARFLGHLLSDASVTAMSEANGAVPGTWSALAADPRFAAGGPLALYAEHLSHACGPDQQPGCLVATRPSTPGYPATTYAFAAAVDAVLSGSDPATALDEAARAIDADVARNAGYVREAAP
ncbi:ABC transporter substrate-binding protein [Aquipuribacter nitratireducens]|uniref:ABC transporter substrate-binding protein n=1 Tax=Aquipuribacter nitratireducens TaxID=650104 RepID=A0ABW0GS02_9MICO